ncbi:hypothetical protein M9H77_34269 [Catharanthus roseus]|uniref:Uncharacterized protein n=1 Tax=Catharanthus roseus TaxID=4058 RepID=A0ACB9ZLJ7_CATRO|nr:hypothetical protein M9H77_34269 [Catharanthus roseus]
MSGHCVQGHVDGTGVMGRETGDSLWVKVKTGKELLKYKGSLQWMNGRMKEGKKEGEREKGEQRVIGSFLALGGGTYRRQSIQKDQITLPEFFVLLFKPHLQHSSHFFHPFSNRKGAKYVVDIKDVFPKILRRKFEFQGPT